MRRGPSSRASTGLGPVDARRLVGHFGIAAPRPGGRTSRRQRGAGLVDATARRRLAALSPAAAADAATVRGDPSRSCEPVRRLGLQILTARRRRLPARLLAIELPPPVLFVRGDVAALDRRACRRGRRDASTRRRPGGRSPMRIGDGDRDGWRHDRVGPRDRHRRRRARSGRARWIGRPSPCSAAATTGSTRRAPGARGRHRRSRRRDRVGARRRTRSPRADVPASEPADQRARRRDGRRRGTGAQRRPGTAGLGARAGPRAATSSRAGSTTRRRRGASSSCARPAEARIVASVESLLADLGLRPEPRRRIPEAEAGRRASRRRSGWIDWGCRPWRCGSRNCSGPTAIRWTTSSSATGPPGRDAARGADDARDARPRGAAPMAATGRQRHSRRRSRPGPMRLRAPPRQERSG